MNKTVIFDDEYGLLFSEHLQRIKETIEKALKEHPRTTVIRVDLHFPDYIVEDICATDSAAITRFTASLRAKIIATQEKSRRGGKRIHRTAVRIIWCKEYDSVGVKPHYHIALLLNKDAYKDLGDYQSNNSSLAAMIIRAWYSAIRIPCPENPKKRSLVKFPANPVYWLCVYSDRLDKDIEKVMFRLRYMAKVRSKHYESGYRLFGYSQK
ncbi:inovirus Gp2 family protein [Kosakonia sacchari]|uniref:inovirus Gp2 family protein n=1 Tax=Kosakonia sacchari TaxID=1158459 RepID=UPI002ACECBFF|nr:inovirus Gp2 family protein [Kosakonia sacchari]MDZ7322012.1 inovirus Gp2 family protein [Kosakonia sacchari]